MKKTLVIILAAAAVLTAAVWAWYALPGPDGYIPPRPEDTQLEFWICEDVSETDWTGHDEIYGWFGAREYLGTGYSAGEQNERPGTRVSYIITAWPDYADGGSFVTGIEITDPAVSVYGLTVNSDPAEFDRVMESMGFEVREVNELYRSASRDGITFSLSGENAPELTITAEVSNREGLVF